MRKYECVVIFDPSLDPTDTKKRDQLISKMFTDGQNVVEVVDWGKKQFQFPIRKQTEGVYVLVKLEAERINSGELMKRIKLEPMVLRYLLTAEA